MLQRGDSVAGAVQRDHPQGPHALPNGDFTQLAGVGASDDQFADFVADRHRFNDREAPGITGVFAPLAAAPPVESHTIEDARVDIQVLIHLGWIGDRLFAMGTDTAHETLSAGQND